MNTREYEAMFLLDNTVASENFEAAAEQVDQILEKHGAEIVLKEKWDERKLAYEIKGHRRATYYLVYFRAPTASIDEIEGDARLNEVILRNLVIALDEPIDQHIKVRAEEKEKMAEESRRAALSGWGDRRKSGGGRRDREEGGAGSSSGGAAERPTAAATAAPAAPAAPAPAAPAAPAPATSASSSETPAPGAEKSES